MTLDQIKQIAIDNQKTDNWELAHVVKFKNGETAVYYKEQAWSNLEHEAYIVLDILERGSIPISEIAVYCYYGGKTSGLDMLSYYLTRTLLAINRENLNADTFLCNLEDDVHRHKLSKIIVPTLKEIYCQAD